MPKTNAALVRELRKIRISFRQLARSFDRLAPALAKATQDGTRPPRRKPKISKNQRAALKLQGRYMGTMRGLKASDQAKVKKIRAEKGIRAAIAEARRMAR